MRALHQSVLSNPLAMPARYRTVRCSKQQWSIMGIELVELGSEFIPRCAALMMAANPWDKLYFTTAQCEESLASPGMRIHGLLADGELLGFLSSLAAGLGGEPLIEYLCVADGHRSQGLGTRLINFFEEELFPDADNVYLFVSDINPAAIRLYVRLGYQQVGAFPNFNLEAQTEFLHRKSRRPRQAANRAALQSA